MFKEKIGRVCFWFFFSVLFGCFPLFASATVLFIHQDSVDWYVVLAKGDVLVLACALSGASLGDLFYRKNGSNLKKALIGFVAILMVTGASFVFGVISDQSISQKEQFPTALISLWILGISILIGAAVSFWDDE